MEAHPSVGQIYDTIEISYKVDEKTGFTWDPETLKGDIKLCTCLVSLRVVCPRAMLLVFSAALVSSCDARD